MLPINWRKGAKADLAKIVRYIARENPIAARHMRKVLQDSVLPLAEHPYLFRESERIPGCREIVVTRNYVVLYRVIQTAVEIVAVVHAARNFPE